MVHVVAVGLLVFAVACSYAAVQPFNYSCNTYDACSIQSFEWFSTTSCAMITGDDRVWLSSDQGYTWTGPVMKLMNRIVGYPQNPQVMYFLPNSNASYTYTTDGGATFQNNTLPTGVKNIRTFLPHPTQLGWALTIACLSTDPTVPCSLYTTKNYGTTWRTVFLRDLSNEDNSPIAFWGNATSEPDLIFVWRKSYAFGFTVDYGTSFVTLYGDTFGGFPTNHYYFVLVAEGGNAYLEASSYRKDPSHKAPSSYVRATFPYGKEDFNGQDYYFLDDTTRSEYVAIHLAGWGSYGAIYTSEFDGDAFDLSINNVYRYSNDQGTWYDFTKFRGLGGIYLINVVMDTTARVFQKQTLATYDNGGKWQPFFGNAYDINGKPFICARGTLACSVHLHIQTGLYTAGIPSLRTHSSAIGLIVGNGNYGTQLAEDLPNVSTFFSRDAGITWNQIYTVATVFEFGNHGGILVLTPADTLVNYVMYSFNQGLSFTQVNFTTAPVIVTGIFTDPFGTGYNFIITAQLGPKNLIFSLTLSDSGLQNCGDSDFETWSPSNGLAGGAACFMGQTTVYQRRKQTSQCYNNRNTDVVVSQTPCPCTFDDYECAPNFVISARNSTSGFTCTSLTTNPPCNPDEIYNEVTGYTLVPDTACQGGLDLVGKPQKCPSKSRPAEVAAAVIVTLTIVGAVAGVGLLYWKNDRFRNWVSSLRSGGGAYREINHHDDEDNTA